MINLTRKKSLIIVIAIFVVACVLFIPKIMLRNNIYYLSLDINRLDREYLSLKEENRFLSQQLEDIKFKNQIMDSIIMRKFENANSIQLEQNQTIKTETTTHEETKAETKEEE